MKPVATPSTIDTRKVEFFRHSVGDEEKRAVTDVLDSLFLTTGTEVYEFEREFASYLGVPEVVAVSSCTAAEHLTLVALGIGPGHEVITTPMTFIATATAILHTGATPVFVDDEADTGNIDPERVAAAITPRTKAIVGVHLFGSMLDVQALRAIADEHGLALIEDSAHCVEGLRAGARPGQVGDAASFSFYATKSITCGEGGAIAVRSGDLAAKLRTIRLHGMSKNAADRYSGLYQHWDMVELGYKSNMTNIQAAMLRPQLRRTDAQRDRREDIAAAYDACIDSMDDMDRPVVPDDAISARHLYTIWTRPELRDAWLAHLGNEGIGCAVNYRAIHQLTWLRDHVEVRFDLTNAERIGARTISLPFYDRLTDEEVERVCEVLAGPGPGRGEAGG